jgi:hypothetical protein
MNTNILVASLSLLGLIISPLPAQAQDHGWNSYLSYDPETGLVFGYAYTEKYCCLGQYRDYISARLTGPNVYQSIDYTDPDGWYDYVWAEVWDYAYQSGTFFLDSVHGFFDWYIYSQLGVLERSVYVDEPIQVPASLQIVDGTDSTSPNCGCQAGMGGVWRTFHYQVLDQNGEPIRKVMPISDHIYTGSPNTCYFSGYETTPPGVTTNSDGIFEENLVTCSSACGDQPNCTQQSCTTGADQYWIIDGYYIYESLQYHCGEVTVN